MVKMANLQGKRQVSGSCLDSPRCPQGTTPALRCRAARCSAPRCSLARVRRRGHEPRASLREDGESLLDDLEEAEASIRATATAPRCSGRLREGPRPDQRPRRSVSDRAEAEPAGGRQDAHGEDEPMPSAATTAEAVPEPEPEPEPAPAPEPETPDEQPDSEDEEEPTPDETNPEQPAEPAPEPGPAAEPEPAPEPDADPAPDPRPPPDAGATGCGGVGPGSEAGGADGERILGALRDRRRLGSGGMSTVYRATDRDPRAHRSPSRSSPSTSPTTSSSSPASAARRSRSRS